MRRVVNFYERGCGREYKVHARNERRTCGGATLCRPCRMRDPQDRRYPDSPRVIRGIEAPITERRDVWRGRK